MKCSLILNICIFLKMHEEFISNDPYFLMLGFLGFKIET